MKTTNLTIKTIVLLLLTLFSGVGAAWSQSAPSSIFSQSGYLGYLQYQPGLKHRGVGTSGPWQGLEMKSGGLYFTYLTGEMRSLSADSSMASLNGRILRMGAQLSKRFQLGTGELASVSIEPYVRLGGMITALPNKPVETDVYSGGLEVAPGLEFRVSHVYLSANYGLGYLFNTTLTGGNKRHNLMGGASHLTGWQITIGVDNAFDLLFPREFTFKGRDLRTEIRQSTDYKRLYGPGYNGGMYRIVTTKKTTTSTPGQRTFTLVPPFFGIGPYYSFYGRQKKQAPTSVFGVNGGFRINYFMLDGFYGRGKMGFHDATDNNAIMMTYPKLRHYDFSSQVDVVDYGARVGLNISKLFAELNFEYDDPGASRIAAVPFIRLHGTYTFGQTHFRSEPQFTYADGANRMADFQQKHGITPSSDNNPLLLPERATYRAWGANVEVGSCFIQATWYRYPDAGIANHMSYAIGVNFPVFRAARAFF